VIHVGDFVTPAVLGGLRAINSQLHAVHGNVDRPALKRSLPKTLEIDIGGRRLALIHDAGPAKGRLARMRRRFPEAEAVIFGHSHLPLHEEEDRFQIFNPGSPTERRRAPCRSMGLLSVSEQVLSFRHVWL
jgi:putative phosphoesterase